MEALQQTYDTKDEWPSVSGDQPFDSSRMGEILNKQYQDGPSNIASQTAATENVAAATFSVAAVCEAILEGPS